MASRRPGGAAALESPLLHLSREAERLAALLPKLLAPAARRAALQAAGLPARGGAVGDLRLARELGRNRRLRSALADALVTQLPPAAEEGAAEDAELEPEDRLAQLHRALCGPDAASWDQVYSLAKAWGEDLPARRESRSGASKAGGSPAGGAAQSGGATKSATPASGGAAKASGPDARLKDAKATLKDERQEKARLERELAKAHKSEGKLRKRVGELETKVREAEQRAAETKKRLSAAVAPGTRERTLDKEAKSAKRRASVAEQKLHIVELERDDLRACLMDSDRFRQVAEEDVPSFRERPLLSNEVELSEKLQELGFRPRILVVGGGEPQRRHHDKFAEYGEVMGFDGAWRMAEYVSWHKEMGHLEADMRERFDALVILHWNRTTFTRKAREICNDAGQRPCITCHYEGFTSLRETLQECLRQLIAARP